MALAAPSVHHQSPSKQSKILQLATDTRLHVYLHRASAVYPKGAIRQRAVVYSRVRCYLVASNGFGAVVREGWDVGMRGDDHAIAPEMSAIGARNRPPTNDAYRVEVYSIPRLDLTTSTSSISVQLPMHFSRGSPWFAASIAWTVWHYVVVADVQLTLILLHF
jgi:hypothetical protein